MLLFAVLCPVGFLHGLRYSASAVDSAAVNPEDVMKMPLANGLSTFFVNDNLVFSNGPKSLTRNFPDCTILGN